MTQAVPQSFALEHTYVQLEDGPAARPVPVDADFWQRIGERADLRAGRLVMVSLQGADWPQWEMHPAGDELVCLLSGAVDLILEIDGAERRVALRGRSFVIVPQGIWHR